MEPVIDRNPDTNPIYQRKISTKTFRVCIDVELPGIQQFNNDEAFLTALSIHTREEFRADINRQINGGHIQSMTIGVNPEDYGEPNVSVSFSESDAAFSKRISDYERRILSKLSAPKKPMTYQQKLAYQKKEKAVREAKALLKKQGIDVDALLQPQIEF